MKEKFIKEIETLKKKETDTWGWLMVNQVKATSESINRQDQTADHGSGKEDKAEIKT